MKGVLFDRMDLVGIVRNSWEEERAQESSNLFVYVFKLRGFDVQLCSTHLVHHVILY